MFATRGANTGCIQAADRLMGGGLSSHSFVGLSVILANVLADIFVLPWVLDPGYPFPCILLYSPIGCTLVVQPATKNWVF